MLVAGCQIIDWTFKKDSLDMELLMYVMAAIKVQKPNAGNQLVIGLVNVAGFLYVSPIEACYVLPGSKNAHYV